MILTTLKSLTSFSTALFKTKTSVSVSGMGLASYSFTINLAGTGSILFSISFRFAEHTENSVEAKFMFSPIDG